MMRTDEMAGRPFFSSWVAASLAFAFLVGACLAIPLSNGLIESPTGYGVVAPSQSGGRSHAQKGSGLDGDVSGRCIACGSGKLTDRIPPTVMPKLGVDV